jgi:hypothetical protein
MLDKSIRDVADTLSHVQHYLKTSKCFSKSCFLKEEVNFYHVPCKMVYQ